MGRGKIEIKRINNTTNRQVTFSKRRGGLLKKARELAVLTDAQIGLIIFSASGKLYEYHSPTKSMEEIINEYQKAKNIHFEDLNNDQQYLHSEIAEIRHENDKLQAVIKQFSGEDLAGLTINDLNQLEEQLEFSVNKVRTRKHQLLHQQLENLRRKEHILEHHNSCLYRTIMTEHQMVMEQHHMVDEHKVREMDLLEPFGQFLDDPGSLLQLGTQMHSFQLQPIHSNLQEAGPHGHGP